MRKIDAEVIQRLRMLVRDYETASAHKRAGAASIFARDAFQVLPSLLDEIERLRAENEKQQKFLNVANELLAAHTDCEAIEARLTALERKHERTPDLRTWRDVPDRSDASTDPGFKMGGWRRSR